MRSLHRISSAALVFVMLLSLTTNSIAVTVSSPTSGLSRTGTVAEFTLTVRVLDDKDNPVVGAVVTVWKDNFGDILKYDYQDVTDKNGRAEFKNIVSIEATPKIFIKAFKSSGGGVGEDTITLTKSQTAHVIKLEDSSNQVMIKAVDGLGNPVGGALVNVWDVSSVGPADHQFQTYANGELTFSIQPGRSKSLSVQVIKGDLQGKANISLPAYGTTTIKLNLVDNTMVFGMNPKDQINLRIWVGNKENDPVAGARLVFRSTGVRRVFTESATESDGNATARLIADDYDVEVSKVGYETETTTVRLNVLDRGKTVKGPEIKLSKKVSSAKTVSVAVRVQNKADNAFVTGAQVMLVSRFGESPRVYQDNTDQAGEVRIPVDDGGRFDLKISQDNFETLTQSITVPKGQPEMNFPPFFLTEKEAPSEKVNITVVAGDKNRAAIQGASVRVGNITTPTDSNGFATITTTFGIESGVVVTASAKGYKTKTQTVPVRRGVDYSDAQAQVTIVLEPGSDPANEASPVELIIVVQDSAGMKRLEGAVVKFIFPSAGREKELGTNADGEVAFRRLKDEDDLKLSDIRKGVTLNIRRPGYLPLADRTVPVSMLAPSNEPIRYSVLLDRDWSALEKALAELEPRVKKWFADRFKSGQGLLPGIRDLESNVNEKDKLVTALVTEIKSFPANPCESIASSITGHQGSAAAKQQEMSRLVRNANQRAATCKTVEEAALIKSDYNSAYRLLGEIGAIEKKAVSEVNAVSTKFDAWKATLDEVNARVKTINREILKIENSFKIYEVDKLDKEIEDLSTMPQRQAALSVELQTLRTTHQADVAGIGLPDATRKKIDELAALLKAEIETRNTASLIDARSTLIVIQITLKDMKSVAERAERGAASFASAKCTDKAQPILDRLGDVVLAATGEIEPAADLPRKAEACKTLGACQPVIARIRGLLQSDDLAGAEAAIQQAKAQSCPVDDLESALEDKRLERQAANLLAASLENCKFDEALELARQMPASFRSRPLIARAMAAVQRGSQAKSRIETLKTNAAAEVSRTGSNASASFFISQAEQAATGFVCLTEQVNAFRQQYATIGLINRPKLVVEEIPEKPSSSSRSDPPPAVEEIPEIKIKTPTVDEIPEQTQPPLKPTQPQAKESKPKNTGPGFWEKLGTAINQTIAAAQNPNSTGGQQQPNPQQQPTRGRLGLSSSWLKPPNSDKRWYGSTEWTYTGTTATKTDTWPPNEGGNLLLNWQFSGVPIGGLVPGQTYTITVTGTFTTSLDNRDLEYPAIGQVFVEGDVEIVKSESGAVHKKFKRTGTYTFKVKPNARSVSISLNADYNISTFAVYKFGDAK